MPKRAEPTRQALKSGQPPMPGFLIHLLAYVIVVGGLAAWWVLVVWGIALAAHDITLLIRSFSARG